MALTFLLHLLVGAAPAAPDDGLADGEITVEGEREGAPDASATSASVTVVEVDETLAASADVADVVEGAAGTSVASLGGLGDFSAVSIRGSSLRQVQVFLDGVPLNPDGADVVNLSELPLRAFQRVELYRGGAPASFAASPAGGVVNLVTAEGPQEPDAAITYGALDTSRLTAFDGFGGRLAEQPLDGLIFAEAFRTRGDFEYFDDHATPYALMDDRIARRENNDKSQLTAHGRVRWGGPELRLGLLDAFLARDEGLPGSTNSAFDQARLQTLRNLAVLTADSRLGLVRAQGRIWLLQRQETLDDRAGEIAYDANWERSWFTTAGGMGTVTWVPRPWLAPSATVAVRRDSYVQAELTEDRVEHPRTRGSGTLSLAADLRLWHERLTVSPVVQGQAIDNSDLGSMIVEAGSETIEPPDDLLAWTPRLGVLMRPIHALSLKGNLSRSIRPPDLTELYGDRGAVIGNPTLRPERGWSADVGGRLLLPAEAPVTGSLELAHFWSHTDDLVVYLQNAQGSSVPTNIGVASSQGVEAALTLDGWGWVDSNTSLTWTLSRNLTPDGSVAGNQLPRIPEWELWQATGVHWREHVRVGHTYSYTDGNFWDATNFYQAAPRTLHGAFLRGQPAERWPSIELSVLNLADRIAEVVPRNPLDPSDEARVVSSITDFAGYPLPGRTWMLTVRWSG